MGDNMLVKFTVSNFRNFNEPISIDFSAVHDYKFNQHCVKNGLISKAIIFGHNASGKSNLGFAIFDIVGLLTDKMTIGEQKDNGSFLNADNNAKVARFEYVFKKDDVLITYIYEKSNATTIVYEELRVNDDRVYSYDFVHRKANFDRLAEIEAGTLNFEYFENNLPILRYIANNTNQGESSIVRFIMHFVSHMLWFRSVHNNNYIGFTTGVDHLTEWIINNNLVKDFQAFLREFAGINVTLDTIVVENPSPARLLVERHGNKPLLFESVASNGTRALELFFYWSRQFNEVSFLFIDEFDAYYHIELSRRIVKYIAELDNVQAIFTSHNTYLASNELLRPDCYFFIGNGRLVSFADSAGRELREGHNLEKLLRNGEFDV